MTYLSIVEIILFSLTIQTSTPIHALVSRHDINKLEKAPRHLAGSLVVVSLYTEP